MVEMETTLFVIGADFTHSGDFTKVAGAPPPVMQIKAEEEDDEGGGGAMQIKDEEEEEGPMEEGGDGDGEGEGEGEDEDEEGPSAEEVKLGNEELLVDIVKKTNGAVYKVSRYSSFSRIIRVK